MVGFYSGDNKASACSVTDDAPLSGGPAKERGDAGRAEPEIIYRSPALPEAIRARLREPGYAPHITELLMKGLPIVDSEDGPFVEYPDGHRIRVERYDVTGDEWAFRRYRYETALHLIPALR